jgi:hypothetical protein
MITESAVKLGRDSFTFQRKRVFFGTRCVELFGDALDLLVGRRVG